MRVSDQTRFEDLYRRFSGRVLAYCVRRAGSVDGQDAAAEVFLVAWRKLDEIPSGGAALLWLYGAAFRVLSHRWRSTFRRGRAVLRLSNLASVDMANAPETILVQSEEFRRVREAASSLDSADQEILRLTLWEELSHAEVAAVLGIESGAAKQRAYRARQRLGIEYRRLAGEASDPPAARKGKEVPK